MSGNPYADLLDLEEQRVRQADAGRLTPGNADAKPPALPQPSAPIQQPAAAQPAANQNPYLDLLDQQEATQRTATRAVLNTAAAVNPDEAGEAAQLARRYPAPADVLLRNLRDAKLQAAVDDFDARLPTSPALARQVLRDPNLAKVGHDDSENLSLLETVVNSFKRGVPGLKQNFSAISFGANANILNQIDAIDKRSPPGTPAWGPGAVLDTEDPYGIRFMSAEQRTAFRNAVMSSAGTSAANIAQRQAERGAIPAPAVVQRVMQAKGWSDALSAFMTDPVKFVASVGPESLAQSAPSLVLAAPATVVAGPAAGAVVVGGGSFTTDYGSSLLEALSAEGVDISKPEELTRAAQDGKLMKRVAAQAMAHAEMVGAFDALSAGQASKSLLPAKVLAKKPLAREAANLVAQTGTQGAMGGAGEALGEIAAGQDLQPGNILAEVAGEAFGAPAEVASMAAGRVRESMHKASQAEVNTTTIEQLNKLAEASKVLQRDPPTFQAFVEAAAEQGPVQDVFISAEALAQSGVAEEVVAASPSVQAQFATALETGGDIKIPVAEYATTIAGQSYAQNLVDHLKVEADGFSRAEAQEFMKTSGEELRKQVEQALASNDEEQRAGRQAVEAKVLEQLQATKRFTDEVNSQYASLVGAFYATQAQRLGITAQEMFDRFPLRVQAQLPTGESLPQGERGFFTPGSNTITLLKTADLSTFTHEFGHAQLEMLSGIASQPDAPAEIKADMQALLDWFGVKADSPDGALSTWNRMTLDEKRQHHEQFARGFEAYLFEGKAPSVELRSVFQRFRSWLVNVYRQIKALNVTLTPEVRSVMDRLVATEDQIRSAEAAASMGLLFKTPEEAAKFGVDWQAYHDQAEAATQAAVAELGERGLKDMQWLSRAKSRELKRLQKAAESKRREVEAEVRAELMAKPVYQAWQYLTGKPVVELNEADKEALAQHAAALKGWKDKRAEAETKVKADVKAELLAEHPDLKGLDKGQFLAKNKRQLEINAQQRMLEWDQANPKPVKPTPGPQAPVEADAYGKLDAADVKARYGNADGSITRTLAAEGMLKADGEDPDITAELFGYDSGDAMMQALATAKPPEEAVAEAADQRMLERFGDITSPEALDNAANEAIHNIARAKFVATELNALQKANDARADAGADKKGRPRTAAILPEAARQFAADLIARLKVRDVSPGQYQAAEAKAGREAAKALKAGDLVGAAREKRNQLINHYAAKEAFAAQAEIGKALKYFARAERSEGIDAEYRDQIEQLLARFNLKREPLKKVDQRKSLEQWVEQQRARGVEPIIPEALLAGFGKQSYKDMTVEEVRGLVDTIKQIEHLGRLKSKLLTAKDQRTYEAIRDEIAASVEDNSRGRTADTRTPTTILGRKLQAIKNFGAAHIKAATWARIFDGNKDGGPVWERLIQPANARGDWETTQRAEVTQRLNEILKPVRAGGRMGGKGKYFPSIKRSLNRESIFTIALNMGNASNLQRLLGGEGWTLEQLKPVLETLSAADWQAVQQVWDLFETFKPQIGAKEKRVYGKEPPWIEPTPVVTKFGTLKGGYYPVKYDPVASIHAEEHAAAEEAKAQLKGAYNAATTRRSFTKARVDEVRGRPLLYTLQGLYSGLNDVIHDLAWHEWLIDANRLLKSEKIDTAIRSHYGPAAVQQLRSWRDAIAVGDGKSQEAMDIATSWARKSVSLAGLAFNLKSALMQPLGLTQSIVRVGGSWIAKGAWQYIGSPIASTREVNAKSEFMRNRSRTRFRELNEIRGQVQGKGVHEMLAPYAYVLMMRFQQAVDVPTWMGAYEKAISEGNSDERASALADQAVIDSQGGGQLKDQSAIERGGPTQKLFTVFYSFMNTALNIGVAQGMSERAAAKKAVDFLLLYTVPAMLGYALSNALVPGDSGDEDKLARKLALAQLEYLFGLIAFGREFAPAARALTGDSSPMADYHGPSGLRLLTDTTALGKQVSQGEFDDAFRKALINEAGDLLGIPSAQINRTVTGAQALSEGKTTNPAALAMGYQEPH